MGISVGSVPHLYGQTPGQSQYPGCYLRNATNFTGFSNPCIACTHHGVHVQSSNDIVLLKAVFTNFILILGLVEVILIYSYADSQSVCWWRWFSLHWLCRRRRYCTSYFFRWSYRHIHKVEELQEDKQNYLQIVKKTSVGKKEGAKWNEKANNL